MVLKLFPISGRLQFVHLETLASLMQYVKSTFNIKRYSHMHPLEKVCWEKGQVDRLLEYVSKFFLFRCCLLQLFDSANFLWWTWSWNLLYLKLKLRLLVLLGKNFDRDQQLLLSTLYTCLIAIRLFAAMILPHITRYRFFLISLGHVSSNYKSQNDAFVPVLHFEIGTVRIFPHARILIFFLSSWSCPSMEILGLGPKCKRAFTWGLFVRVNLK